MKNKKLYCQFLLTAPLGMFLSFTPLMEAKVIDKTVSARKGDAKSAPTKAPIRARRG